MRTHTARFVAGADKAARIPNLNLPEVAFAGRSNVGKSSLLNRLVGHQRLARVSKTPGRTQQINFFVIDDRAVFADLPGYGFARVPLPVKEQWKHLVEAYLGDRSTLRAVVVLVDVRRGLQTEDEQLLEYLSSMRIAAILTATKLDKLTHSERLKQLRALSERTRAIPNLQVVACSAVSGEGMGDLWAAVEAALKSS